VVLVLVWVLVWVWVWAWVLVLVLVLDAEWNSGLDVAPGVGCASARGELERGDDGRGDLERGDCERGDVERGERDRGERGWDECDRRGDRGDRGEAERGDRWVEALPACFRLGLLEVSSSRNTRRRLRCSRLNRRTMSPPSFDHFCRYLSATTQLHNSKKQRVQAMAGGRERL